MQYPAVVVANEIIKLANAENHEITPLKLQKILYLANGISYKRRHSKLVDESFEAWEYGPVVRSVYELYKNFKGNNITAPQNGTVQVPSVSGNQYSFVPSSTVKVNNDDLAVIKEAWNSAKDLDAYTLSAWSHNNNSPWDKAYNATPRQVYISDADIQSYFDQFIQD
jgi:uncharacterized phage-associated protein